METAIDQIFESRSLSPSSAEKIVTIKKAATALLRECEKIEVTTENGYMMPKIRFEIEEIVMWSVKACSRENKEPPQQGEE